MGTPAFALPALEAITSHHRLLGVVTRPDRRRGRGQRVSAPEVKHWAVSHGVSVEQPATLREPEAQERLASYRPDVIVVVAYGLILPPAVLAIPSRGCINLHASLLPRHRGAAPVAWAILEGDRETGVTTMLMDEGMDTGPILMQAKESIGPRDTTPALAERLARKGADLLAETLESWSVGEPAAEPQDDNAATLAPRFSKDDGEVDWQLPATAIDRRVRALQPWPGVFTFVGHARLRLWSVLPHSPAPEFDAGRAGRILRCDADGIWVRCGARQVVQITELQPAGGTRQAAVEYLRGHDLPVGTRLGKAAGTAP